LINKKEKEKEREKKEKKGRSDQINQQPFISLVLLLATAELLSVGDYINYYQFFYIYV